MRQLLSTPRHKCHPVPVGISSCTAVVVVYSLHIWVGLTVFLSWQLARPRLMWTSPQRRSQISSSLIPPSIVFKGCGVFSYKVLRPPRAMAIAYMVWESLEIPANNLKRGFQEAFHAWAWGFVRWSMAMGARIIPCGITSFNIYKIYNIY